MRAQLAPGQLTCVLTKQFYSQTEQGAGVKEKEMPSVPEELNVFRRPHGLMIKLVKDIEREVSGNVAFGAREREIKPGQ